LPARNTELSIFANGATPGGILEHPGVVKDPDKVRDSWNAAFGGSSNSNKVAVLEEGMKYTPISISPEQAQFLETRKFQIDEIASIFRISLWTGTRRQWETA
jgi:HK97 family phage portal protein